MAYSLGTEDHVSDAYMEGFTLTNEMLSPSFFLNVIPDGTGLTLPGTPFASNSTIPIEHQKADMQSILDIFHLDEEIRDHNSGSDDEEDEPKHVDYEDRNRRIERLRSIYPALDRLWWSGSDYMTGAAEKLADGSRDRKSTFGVPHHLYDPFDLAGLAFHILQGHLILVFQLDEHVRADPSHI